MKLTRGLHFKLLRKFREKCKLLLFRSPAPGSAVCVLPLKQHFEILTRKRNLPREADTAVHVWVLHAILKPMRRYSARLQEPKLCAVSRLLLHDVYYGERM